MILVVILCKTLVNRLLTSFFYSSKPCATSLALVTVSYFIFLLNTHPLILIYDFIIYLFISTILFPVTNLLYLCFFKDSVRYFLSNFYFFSKRQWLSKTMKNVFYFIQKALFVLKIFIFLWFFPFLSTLSRFKSANGSGIIYNAINWLA